MFKKVLIANRGEIAIRIARACADLDIASVAIHSQDDAGALHTLRADAAIALKGEGAGAYLDIAGVIAAAKASGAEAIHPGYGFLSENADFARACGAAGVVFIGPDAETIALLGDKARARALAQAEGLAVLRGSEGGVSAGDAKAFLRDLKRGRAMMIKAVAGGGGRGMAIARKAEEVEAAFGRCAAEAGAAFGNDALYVEEFLPRARHIEVQIAGDGQSVIHLHERDCSVQRRHQKLIEIAPSPFIGEETRARVLAAAVKLGQAAQYRALGTIEFLVDADAPENFYFMEANPRLQVEHTITEEALGLDLVRLQMELAAGRSLVSLSLLQRDAPQPRGYSIQARVNLERVNEDGAPLPSGGAISLYEPPTGPGVRVDGAGHAGLHPNPRFDTLMAKVICTAPHFAAAAAKCARALKEFRVEGADTNIPVLRALLASEDFLSGAMTTRFYDENFSSLLDSVRGFGGAQAKVRQSPAAAEGLLAITAPLRGTICAIHAEVGQTVRKGDEVALIEAMKMQHAIVAQESGVVLSVEAALGETLDEDAPFLFIEAQAGEAVVEAAAAERDLDEWRADL
ncbi:MAG: biotin carboxylase N-terminal domain-containing protein, partial [Hyphomonadaceae bacterium]